ncbi:MAG: hypothetical protein ACQKBY_03925 [Verrucomicrobiales bacterium]
MKKFFKFRYFVNLLVAALFFAFWSVHDGVLAEVQVIGELTLAGISKEGTQLLAYAALAGGLFSLLNFRSGTLFTGLILGLLILMGLSVKQDLDDLSALYPQIEGIRQSVTPTGTGRLFLGLTSLLTLSALVNTLLPLFPRRRKKSPKKR